MPIRLADNIKRPFERPDRPPIKGRHEPIWIRKKLCPRCGRGKLLGQVYRFCVWCRFGEDYPEAINRVDDIKQGKAIHNRIDINQQLPQRYPDVPPYEYP